MARVIPVCGRLATGKLDMENGIRAMPTLRINKT